MVDQKLIAQVRKTLVEHEGEMASMYLDSEGFVTCGVGHLLRNAEAAVELRWRRKSDAGLASPAEVQAEYEATKNAEAGMLPLYYSGRTKLRLPSDFLADLLDADLKAVLTQMRAELPEVDSFPVEAQEALLDMAFNLGVGGLCGKFPKLIACVNERDWKGAALECHRAGIGETRNAVTRALFLTAGIAVRPAEAVA